MTQAAKKPSKPKKEKSKQSKPSTDYAERFQSWWIDDEVYSIPIAITKGNGKGLQRFFRQKFGIEDFDDGDIGGNVSAQAIRASHPEKGISIILWFSPTATRSGVDLIRSVIHETCHATHFVMMAKGMYLSDDSMEAFAYYQTWLFDRVMERIGGGM